MMSLKERMLNPLTIAVFVVSAVLALSACESTREEEKSSDNDIQKEAYPVATVTVPALVAAKSDFIELVQSRGHAGGMDDVRELERLADVIVSLESVLGSDLEAALHTRDPALAIDMMGWSTDLAGELLAEVGGNVRLAELLGERRGGNDLGRGNPSGLSDSPGLSKFESSLGGLMGSLSDYMQSDPDGWPGEGEDNDRGANNESSDPWVNYLNDRVPQGADPDPNDPDVDATGDTWNDYLNDDAAPGADPDRPDEGSGNDTEGDGEEIEVGDGDVVIIWTDGDGNLDRVEKNKDEGETGDTGNDGADDGAGTDGDDGASGGDGNGTSGGGSDPDDGTGDDGESGTGSGDEEMPCDPNIDGCNTGGGEVPDTDPNDGTTQPGLGDAGNDDPEIDLGSKGGGLGPLILVGPDHQQRGAVVLVVRSPTYGQTQPGLGDDRFNGGFWKGDVDVIGGRIDQLFSRSRELAEGVAELCAPQDC